MDETLAGLVTLLVFVASAFLLLACIETGTREDRGYRFVIPLLLVFLGCWPAWWGLTTWVEDSWVGTLSSGERIVFSGSMPERVARPWMTRAKAPEACSAEAHLGEAGYKTFGRDHPATVSIVGMAARGQERYLVSVAEGAAAPSRCDPRFLVDANAMMLLEKGAHDLHAEQADAAHVGEEQESDSVVAVEKGRRVATPTVPDKVAEGTTRSTGP